MHRITMPSALLSQRLLTHPLRQKQVVIGDGGRSVRNMYAFLCLCAVILLVGCEPKGFYPLTIETILAKQKEAPGEIFLVEGSRFGCFKEGPGAVGNVDTSGSLTAKTKYGDQRSVKWPATPGYYYEASSYINELEECLYVVRKIKAK